MTKRAAPIVYDDDIAADICGRISRGDTLTVIEQEDGMPSSLTVWNWRRAHPDFDAMFQKAREDQVHAWADQIVGMMDTAAPNDYYIDLDDPQVSFIFEDHPSAKQLKKILNGPNKIRGRIRVKLDRGHLNHVKEKIRVRQWLMSRIAPHHYGDQKTVHNTFSVEQRDDREIISDLADALQQSGLTPGDLVSMLEAAISEQQQDTMH